MSPFILAAFALALVALFLIHLRELRALRSAMGTLAARIPPTLAPSTPTAAPVPDKPARPEPSTSHAELSTDRDSTEALTQVMPNPIKPIGVDLSSVPAQLAAGLARPKSQRSPGAPHPPPVKVGPPRSTPPPCPLPPVSPPPRPRTGTLPSMPAQSPSPPVDPADQPTRS